MVWILSPVDLSLGLPKCHFTLPGRYKVGRKDCAVVIQTDKTVSRLHAEFTIEQVDAWNASEGFLNIPRPRIRLKDLSKFGTFVNKALGSKPVFSLPGQEIVLKEGDIINFGTCNSSFRLDFLPILLHVSPLIEKSKEESAVGAVVAIGGHIVEKWCEKCTHLVVDEGSPVTKTVIEAIIQRKPVISIGWIEAVAARVSPASEFPDFLRFEPTLKHTVVGNATSLKIIAPEKRSTLFQGFTFVMGPAHMYEAKEHLQLLVEVSGGLVIPISDRHMHNQLGGGTLNQQKVLLIVPLALPKLQRWLSTEDIKFVLHMPRTSEEKVVAAALSGQMDSATWLVPASPASSASTDETVEADVSEHGEEDAASHMAVESAACQAFKSINTTLQPVNMTKSKCQVERLPCGVMHQNLRSPVSTRSLVGSLPTSGFAPADEQLLSSNGQFRSVRQAPHGNLTLQTNKKVIPKSEIRLEKIEGATNSTSEISEESKADIIFSSDLIVNRDMGTSGVDSLTVPIVKNFKCFKKKQRISGNSFGVLVPFAKEVYRESDYGQEIKEYMLQEKRRKEAEALAEELFNAEQLKRKKASTAKCSPGSGAAAIQQKHLGKMKAR